MIPRTALPLSVVATRVMQRRGIGEGRTRTSMILLSCRSYHHLLYQRQQRAFPTNKNNMFGEQTATVVGDLGCTCRRWHYQYHGPGSPLLVSSSSLSAVDKNNNDDLLNDASSSSSSSTNVLDELWKTRNFWHRGFTVGIGGPVGSGKTATVLALCRALTQINDKEEQGQDQVSYSSTSRYHHFPPIGVVTNDIFTQEDAEFLTKHKALPEDCIIAVETGGCPHAAIREDVSANLSALEDLTHRFLHHAQEEDPHYYHRHHDNDDNDNQHKSSEEEKTMNTSSLLPPPPLLFCESGGDNLAANFSRELADLTIYVIDVAGGDKVPRKGGPGITESDLLVINKIDLAQAVGANLELMQSQAQDMRSYHSINKHDQNHLSSTTKTQSTLLFAPIVMASIKHKQGLQEIVDFILDNYRKAILVASKHQQDHEYQQDHHHLGHHHHHDA